MENAELPSARASESLGERLRARRERLSLMIDDIAAELRTPARYFHALEENTYAIFPAKVYAEGFLRKYLSALFMDGSSERVLHEFHIQWAIYERNRRPSSPPPNYWISGPYITGARFFLGLGAIALVASLGLFLWQFAHFSRNPRMVLEYPVKDEAVRGPHLFIRGSIERESQLTMNGREITIDGAGNFDEQIELPHGLNTLEFVVENRFGNKSTVVRRVVMQ